MYQPGLGTDQQLAQIRFADILDEAAFERAARRQRANEPKREGRRLAVALAAAVPLVIGLTVLLIMH